MDKQVVVRRGLFGFGLILAIGLVLSTLIAAGTLQKIKSANQTITVKGYAEKRITSDLATWSGSFSARGAELVGAYDKLATDLAIVLAYLDKSGVKRDAVEVSSIGTATINKKTADGKDTNEIEGYRLSQAVSIESTDVALVSKIARESTSLIKEGVEFSSNDPDYFYTRLDELKVEMLGAAAKDAHSRAAQLVGASGGKLGKLKWAEQGVFQITPPNSNDTSGYGVNDTSSVDKVIKAIVTLQFAIE